MKKFFAFLMGVALIGQCGAFAAPTALSADDKAFINDAIQGNMLEVKLGEIAVKNGTGDAKMFGQHMVTDHTKLLADAEKLAKSKGITPAKSLDAKGMAAVTKFSALKGNAFNIAYLKDMQEDHTKDVAAFKKEEASTKDADIKAAIAKALPVIEGHLQMVNKDVGGASGQHKSTGTSK